MINKTTIITAFITYALIAVISFYVFPNEVLEYFDSKLEFLGMLFLLIILSFVLGNKMHKSRASH